MNQETGIRVHIGNFNSVDLRESYEDLNKGLKLVWGHA